MKKLIKRPIILILVGVVVVLFILTFVIFFIKSKEEKINKKYGPLPETTSQYLSPAQDNQIQEVLFDEKLLPVLSSTLPVYNFSTSSTQQGAIRLNKIATDLGFSENPEKNGDQLIYKSTQKNLYMNADIATGQFEFNGQSDIESPEDITAFLKKQISLWNISDSIELTSQIKLSGKIEYHEALPQEKITAYSFSFQQKSIPYPIIGIGPSQNGLLTILVDAATGKIISIKNILPPIDIKSFGIYPSISKQEINLKLKETNVNILSVQNTDGTDVGNESLNNAHLAVDSATIAYIFTPDNKQLLKPTILFTSQGKNQDNSQIVVRFFIDAIQTTPEF